mmetsp:Transcript_8579/g.20190  ORF Transcript_8579/g.20190 Transcript_8579/m.20190 type:complete len:201 (+) Transcript_8579:488-1090(+)
MGLPTEQCSSPARFLQSSQSSRQLRPQTYQSASHRLNHPCPPVCHLPAFHPKDKQDRTICRASPDSLRAAQRRGHRARPANGKRSLGASAAIQTKHREPDTRAAQQRPPLSVRRHVRLEAPCKWRAQLAVSPSPCRPIEPLQRSAARGSRGDSNLVRLVFSPRCADHLHTSISFAQRRLGFRRPILCLHRWPTTATRSLP